MTITTDTTLLHDPRRQAALLYWQGFSVPQIAATLQMKRPTVQSWKQRDGWDSVAPRGKLTALKLSRSVKWQRRTIFLISKKPAPLTCWTRTASPFS